jgi:hypothetical protein
LTWGRYDLERELEVQRELRKARAAERRKLPAALRSARSRKAQLAVEIHNLPRWRWIRRRTLSAEYARCEERVSMLRRALHSV